MNEREPLSIDFSPEVLEAIEIDPIRAFDELDVKDLIGVFWGNERKAAKVTDPQMRAFYEGGRDAGAIVIGLLGLTGVAEETQPFPTQPIAMTEENVKRLIALYFKTLEQERPEITYDYRSGARLELYTNLEFLGQVRAAYRDEEIGPNTIVPVFVRESPGFRKLMEERSGNQS